ncbi:MAG: biopolymer transporter ExbD [Acidobacteriota bacterium]
MIPTASMADIAFLLIIFFMLTTSFSPVRMSVDLAEATTWEVVEKTAAILAINPQGSIEVSDGIAPGTIINTMDELDIFVKEIVTVDPTRQFIIKADRNIRYEAFNSVYEILRRNECRRVALLTEAKLAAQP